MLVLRQELLQVAPIDGVQVVQVEGLLLPGPAIFRRKISVVKIVLSSVRLPTNQMDQVILLKADQLAFDEQVELRHSWSTFLKFLIFLKYFILFTFPHFHND